MVQRFRRHIDIRDIVARKSKGDAELRWLGTICMRILQLIAYGDYERRYEEVLQVNIPEVKQHTGRS